MSIGNSLNTMLQNHVNLNVQNGAVSYDINSLIDDDFEVIGSLSDALHSVPVENGSQIPLFDIHISNSRDITTADSINGTISAANLDAETGGGTSLANSNLNLSSNNTDLTNADVPIQSIVMSSTVSGRSLTTQSTYEDPVSTVESIRADYQAAQKLTQQENDLLRKACERKSQKIAMLRRSLDDEVAQKVQLNAELEELQRALVDCRIKIDETVASKIERDDIIKMQQATIQQLQSNGNFSCLPTNMLNEQALLSSLHEKEQLIEVLKKNLQKAEEKYEKEHKEVLDLEEIVKILHEYVRNEQQTHGESAEQATDSHVTVQHRSIHNDRAITSADRNRDF